MVKDDIVKLILLLALFTFVILAAFAISNVPIYGIDITTSGHAHINVNGNNYDVNSGTSHYRTFMYAHIIIQAQESKPVVVKVVVRKDMVEVFREEKTLDPYHFGGSWPIMI